MSKVLTRLWRGVRNIADDFALLIVTTLGVLLYSYWDTVRVALREHPPESELDWPRWYIVGLCGIVALTVTIVDASRGTSEERKTRMAKRIGKCLIIGLGAMAVLEKLIGGGA